MGCVTSCFNNCIKFISYEDDEDYEVMTNNNLFISTDFIDDGVVHNSMKAPRVRFTSKDDSPPFESNNKNTRYTSFRKVYDNEVLSVY